MNASAGSKAIVLVTTSYPIAGDGSEAAGSFVEDLALELSRHRMCRVVAPAQHNALEKISDRLHVFRYRAPNRPLSTLKPWYPGELFAIMQTMRSGQQATLDAVQAGPTERIIALWALPSGQWARAAAKRFEIPYTVWTLGSDIWSLGRLPLIRDRIRRILQDAERVFADGLQLADDTKQIGRCQVEFLPSTRSIDRAKAAPPRSSAPYRLAFLGRWHPNKGVDLLLDALEQLEPADWEKIEIFRIHGGGPLAKDVRRRAAGLVNAGRPVSVGGYLDKAGAEDLIAESDWLVIPSRVESIPLIYSDALKLRCAVLATPVGDLPELIVRHRSGELAEVVSAAALCRLFSDVLERRRPVDYCGGLGRAAAEFSLTSVARHLDPHVGTTDTAV